MRKSDLFKCVITIELGVMIFTNVLIKNPVTEPKMNVVNNVNYIYSSDIGVPIENSKAPNSITTNMSAVTNANNNISKEDLELLALLTMAEAEGEPPYGQRLVVSTVLNRVDSEHFPNNIHDVIWEKNQFSPMWNGRIENCIVQDDIYQLVLEEVNSRTNKDIVFFNANTYSEYGTPVLNVGNHYFSSYN